MCKLLGLIVAFIFVDAHQLDAHIFLCSLSLVVPVRGLAFRHEVSNIVKEGDKSFAMKFCLKGEPSTRWFPHLVHLSPTCDVISHLI